MPESLAAIIATLRLAVRESAATGKRLAEQVQPLVEQAFSLLDETPVGPDRVILSGGLANALADIALRAQTTRFMGQVMARLLTLGPLGEILCLRVLRESSMTMDKLAAVLAECEEHQKLALANRFFCNPRDMDRKRLEWAVSTARRIQADDPEEALVFLDRLEARGGVLADPTQRELMRSRFGIWVHELLRMELDDEQLAYMARIVGLLGVPSLARELARKLDTAQAFATMEAVLTGIGRAGAPRSEELVQAIRPFLTHIKAPVRSAAMEALRNLRAGEVLAGEDGPLSGQDQGARCLALTHLSADEFMAALSRLDPGDRQEALLRLTALVRRLDSAWLDATVEQLADAKGEDDTAMELVLRAFRDFTAAQPPFRPQPANLGKPAVLAGAEPAVVLESPGQPGQQGAATSAAGSPGLVSDRKIKDARISGVDQFGANIAAAAYKNATIEASVFARARLETTRFIGCAFKDVDFTGARLTTVSFMDCTFTGCVFDAAALEAVSFRNCRLARTRFCEARAKRIRLVQCSVAGCDFGGAILDGLEAESTELAGCHFGAASLLASELSGVEMTECVFEAALVLGLGMRDVRVAGCSFADNRFHNIRGGEPSFREEEERTRRAAVEWTLGIITMEQPAPALSSTEGQQFLTGLLWRWFYEKDARRRLLACRSMNRRRRLWATAMQHGDAPDLLSLITAAVESPQVPGAALPPLACAITSHTPCRNDLTLVERYGLSRPDRGAESTLRLEALYAIGSTGTIAQGRSSDLDLWVCYDTQAFSPLHARALKAKLTAIEKWARQTFGKEVHFFLMDLEAIHANDFGFSDEESAGSTQALLLKEEFYRTAILLAGRPPAWWAAPPRLSRQQYAGFLATLREAVSLRGVDFLDLGVMEAIPRDEYFGAALWQIVKALKSPFKSILKIALLDKYSTGDAGQTLLCESIKEALFEGRRDLWDVDPYAVMFREVFEHFHGLGNEEACDLLRLAFNKKTGLTLASAASDGAFAMRGYSFMEYFFPYSEAQIVGQLERRAKEAEAEDEESFAALVAVGDRILRFMLSTYAAVQERLAEAGSGVRVSPEDLTKMGRRIAARLTPGRNKILPLPFTQMRPGMLTGLEFGWQRSGASGSVWSVRAEFPMREGAKPAPEVLRREGSPEELAAWLVANEIYDPSVPLTAQALEPPLSIPDMQALLKAMREFFPVPDIFDPPVGEALQEERATRIFVTVNLTIPREVKQVSRIAVVWSTSWGQMLCKARLPATEKLRSDPYTELARAMGMPMTSRPAILFHAPHKSHCPAVRLLPGVSASAP
ncbi:class I adenylate cyclase [Oceanidesulfovibrio marinus]|uniref:Adenylate cyclase class-I N-terminal domain-containing protein n=1 Tax=Oceanidesulfovibrio marinus TaxID=370038 RepID=A0ABX6NIJ5_9BACT|nr:class I adenylate cyclase [Oceanidesulfovibrio marinus]QJT09878.1 hypothetical protein E8L03_13445 [Oceanidesulfovibrio marinus]